VNLRLEAKWAVSDEVKGSEDILNISHILSVSLEFLTRLVERGFDQRDDRL